MMNNWESLTGVCESAKALSSMVTLNQRDLWKKNYIWTKWGSFDDWYSQMDKSRRLDINGRKQHTLRRRVHWNLEVSCGLSKI